jgi:hypothetical protein
MASDNFKAAVGTAVVGYVTIAGWVVADGLSELRSAAQVACYPGFYARFYVLSVGLFVIYVVCRYLLLVTNSPSGLGNAECCAAEQHRTLMPINSRDPGSPLLETLIEEP